MPTSQIRRNFFTKIVLPSLLVFILFTISIFAIILPIFEQNMLEGKREMISELTNSAWSILAEFNQKFEEGNISLDDAKIIATDEIQNLRYGKEGKDYFWITDKRPNMIVHPYRPELNGTDLNNYSDPTGKKLFVEFVKVVENSGDGFVDYMWQWKDDSTKIVSKLSYVKLFEPWGWIIGTGIYIEDVKQEISNLTGRLLYVSLGILLLTGIILTYVGRQSFKIESERRLAELGLRESESKYRTLVEASTDGLIMILEGEIVYVNNALLMILGYHQKDIISDIGEIICKKGFENISGVEYFEKLILKNEYRTQIESKLVTKHNTELDVLLYTSEISFGEKSGYTVIVKDISSSKRISEELGENKERFNALIQNISIGVFRITLGKYGKFIEANSSAIKIFGYQDFDKLSLIKVGELFNSSDEGENFFEKLIANGIIKNNVVQVKKEDGNISIVSISAMIVKDESGNDKYCDGIVEDITDRIKLDEERENLIVELQTSLKYLHQPLENFVTKFVTCTLDQSIEDVAKIITKSNYSAALVKVDGGDYVGIVTDHDLRQRVIAKKISTDQSIFTVMSSPLVKIPINSFVYEALMSMNENSTRHLAVHDSSGNVIGMISSEELIQLNRQSSAYLLREIEKAESVEGLADIREKLSRLIKTLVDSGAKTKNITKIITSIYDAIVHKLFELAIKKYGDIPVDFAFVALGSAGRKEQTLISDQDNAIIFDDVPDKDLDRIHEYFSNLAKFVCDGLNFCGYEYCKGEAMAMNPKWTQSLSKWKEYFHNWIATSSQQDLIDISIFFDFRYVYGERSLVEKLREKLVELSDGQAGFFQHLTKNCLLHKPPVGLLGKLVLESKGEKADTFDIKLATMPISDFARIYGLRYNLKETNTLERLKTLFRKGIINKNSYEEIVHAYNFLMQIRFSHQTKQITNSLEVDNYINPEDFTQLEIKTLKNSFSQIVGLQKRLSYEFSGEAI